MQLHALLTLLYPRWLCGVAVQAYQILKHGGVPEENIIVMVQDDLAKNYMNPHPGKVYNRPHGPDVYKGVPLVRCPWQCDITNRNPTSRTCWAAVGVLLLYFAAARGSCHIARMMPLLLLLQDYTGEAVTAATFLAVLAGKKVRSACGFPCS